MTFGKYQGKPLAEIPADYLCWLLTICRLGHCLRRAIKAELKYRGKEQAVVTAPPAHARLPSRPGAQRFRQRRGSSGWERNGTRGASTTAISSPSATRRYQPGGGQLDDSRTPRFMAAAS
jgi:hypothetical protein